MLHNIARQLSTFPATPAASPSAACSSGPSEAAAAEAHPSAELELQLAPASPWHTVPLFDTGMQPGGGVLTLEQKAQLDLDGHVVLPGILTQETCDRTIASLAHIYELEAEYDRTPEGKRKAEIRDLLQHPDLSGAEKQQLNDEINTWAEDGGHGMRMGIRQVSEHRRGVSTAA